MAIEDKDTATDLSVAPVVGPDDPRRFTDSGIEVKTLYTSADLPEDLDLGKPGRVPVHARRARGDVPQAPWTMRQYAGYASAKESNERYKYLLANGSTGPEHGLRPADAARPGLRRPAQPRRGRPDRRGDRHARRHADRVRRHPARRGLDLDDDQRARRGAAAALRAGRRGAGRREPAAARHRPERHPQGVHRPRELHLPARAVACG